MDASTGRAGKIVWRENAKCKLEKENLDCGFLGLCPGLPRKVKSSRAEVFVDIEKILQQIIGNYFCILPLSPNSVGVSQGNYWKACRFV